MKTKISDLINRIGIKIQDPNFERFSSEGLSGRDYCLQEIISQMDLHVTPIGLPYTRIISQVLTENQSQYELPYDLISIIQAFFTDGIERTPVSDSDSPYDENYDSRLTIYRDRVSANQYEVFPLVDPEALARKKGGVVIRGSLPGSSSESDIWINDDGKLYRSKQSYIAGKSSLTITDRPGSSLVFEAVEEGSSFINVSLISGGTSGISTVTFSGSGTKLSPYNYLFTLYENDSSNDRIIELIESDPYLSASGASATSGIPSQFGFSSLINDHSEHWVPVSLELHYKANFPAHLNEDDELHPAFVVPLQNGEAIVLITAASLLKQQRRPQYQSIIDDYYNEANSILLKYQRNKSKTIRRKSARPA